MGFNSELKGLKVNKRLYIYLLLGDNRRISYLNIKSAAGLSMVTGISV
jgi:hypothetical protein